MSSFPDSAVLSPWIFYLLSFLVGSIPFGLLIARLFKVSDLTSRGSGNIGATNVSRVVGFWPAGFLTFVLDVAKGAIPVLVLAHTGILAWIAQWSLWREFTPSGPLWGGSVTEWNLWMAGLAAVLGHCFSPWLHFKGGKGVATGFGAFLMLSPISAACGIVAFALTFSSTKIGSLSSLVGLTLTAISYLVLNPIGAQAWPGAVMVFVILIRHESNIVALLENREKSFK